MNLKYVVWVFFMLVASRLPAQIGGIANFAYLRLPADARTVGKGGVNVSLQDQDVNRFSANPALLRDTLNSWASVNYMRWQAGIDVFQLNYTPKLPKVGTLGISLQVMNYGKMPLTLPNGIQQGTFNANDFALGITKSFKQRYFYYGATLKWVGSSIAGYNAMGLALDIGGLFQHPKKDFAVGLTVRNLGFTLNNYTTTRLQLPLDIIIGTTFKPQYMPFRFSITFQHLQKWDIVYLDPNQSTQLDANGNPIPPQKTWGDKFLRHFVLGSELILSKSFHILLGYNHLQAREMRLDEIGGLRGFSLGCRLQTPKWQFAVARGGYANRAGKTMLTLSSNLSKTFRKKRISQ
jgi:hypothetical protein